MTNSMLPAPAIAAVVDYDLCKACGICSALCPRTVFEAEPGRVPVVARPHDCNGCRSCELHCPDFAICIVAPETSLEAQIEEAL